LINQCFVTEIGMLAKAGFPLNLIMFEVNVFFIIEITR